MNDVTDIHPVPQIPCGRCKRILDLEDLYCQHCGHQDIGLPNVRMASQEIEQKALAERLAEALAEANQTGSRAALDQFEGAVRSSKAVVAVPVARLLSFFAQSDGLYPNYYEQRRSGGRPQRNDVHEGNRERVDGYVNPGYFRKLTCAALSLEDWGAKHYGDCFLVFRNDDAMSRRATVFEENPFVFIEHHPPGPKDSCPPGYRALWEQRANLAVAKLQKKVTGETKSEAFADILLEKDPSATDQTDFVEVHYYGNLPQAAIELVSYSPTAAAQRGWDALTSMLAELHIDVKPLP